MPRKLNKKDILIRLDSYKDNYNFDDIDFNTISIKDEIIVKCNEHGYFTTTLLKFLYSKMKECCYKNCCKYLSQEIYEISDKDTFRYENFIETSKNIHNNFYNYSKFIYKGKSIKGIIECPKHGYFEQCPNNHMTGMGCNECGKENKINYNLKTIIKDGNKPLDLYLIEMYDSNERFNKIGISKNTKKRFEKLKSSGYEIKEILIIPLNIEEAYLIEKSIKDKKHLKYKPLKKFGGYTECLYINKDVEILNIIKKVLIEDTNKSPLISKILDWEHANKKIND